MTGDLNTTFGHRPHNTRGEAATTISHFSFLISNSSFEQSLYLESVDGTPQGLPLNPEP